MCIYEWFEFFVTRVKAQLFLNVSKGPAICDKQNFKHLNMQIKKNEIGLNLYSKTPSDVKQTIWMTKVILANYFSQKDGPLHWNQSNLNYALGLRFLFNYNCLRNEISIKYPMTQWICKIFKRCKPFEFGSKRNVILQ